MIAQKTMKILKIRIWIIIMPWIALNSKAKDFGHLGHSFGITEQAFLQMVDERLQKIDIDAEKKKIVELAKDRVMNPRPLEGMTKVKADRTFYFDPTYTLDQDAVLPCGKVLHAAGTKVNSLEHMTLNRRLFFIDSRDQDQIIWLQAQLKDNLESETGIKDLIILVGGDVFKLKTKLAPEHKNNIYFDQQGKLTNRFGIEAVPAIATQEGLLLKIKEIKITKDQ